VAYVKLLLDKSKEYLDIPTSSIGFCNFSGGEIKVVGNKPIVFRIFCFGFCNDQTKGSLYQFFPVMNIALPLLYGFSGIKVHLAGLKKGQVS
tara:strand:+ start:658 stop:933 length:276 start_codon:yes stop_codon:yes gene_type:complete